MHAVKKNYLLNLEELCPKGKGMGYPVRIVNIVIY